MLSRVLLAATPVLSAVERVRVLVAQERLSSKTRSPCQSSVKTGPMQDPTALVDVLRRTATQTPEMASFPRRPAATSRLEFEAHGTNSIDPIAAAVVVSVQHPRSHLCVLWAMWLWSPYMLWARELCKVQSVGVAATARFTAREDVRCGLA
jgi:hypothetical protein